jgi:hypothetical protein
VDDEPALQGVSIVNPRVVGVTADIPRLVTGWRIRHLVLALAERRRRLPIDLPLDLKVGGTTVQDAASFYEAVTGKTSRSCDRAGSSPPTASSPRGSAG